MKIKKNKRRNRFNYGANKKRVKKNRLSTGKVHDPTIRQFWECKKSVQTNINSMGLSHDPNKSIPVPNIKKQRLEFVKMVNGFVEEDAPEMGSESTGKSERKKQFVADMLEEDANAPREKRFRLPKGVVEQLSYFLDKYQLDYKAMVRDKKNHDQLTWKQFRGKIKRFMSIPEQFNEYLTSRNIDAKQLKMECDSDDE